MWLDFVPIILTGAPETSVEKQCYVAFNNINPENTGDVSTTVNILCFC